MGRVDWDDMRAAHQAAPSSMGNLEPSGGRTGVHRPCNRWGLHARRYLEGKARLLYPEPEDVFPCDLIDADHCRPPSSYV